LFRCCCRFDGEVCVLTGLLPNFANIIALPLLLGVGVAFKIYYIMAWRAGQTDLLQSSLTRAVIWSALTTATAFGSLWLSATRHVQHGKLPPFRWSPGPCCFNRLAGNLNRRRIPRSACRRAARLAI
jgi:hypothetical protein